MLDKVFIVIVVVIIILLSVGLLSNSINDQAYIYILNSIEKREAVDQIGAVIKSENEIADGTAYKIVITNDSGYAVYALEVSPKSSFIHFEWKYE